MQDYHAHNVRVLIFPNQNLMDRRCRDTKAPVFLAVGAQYISHHLTGGGLVHNNSSNQINATYPTESRDRRIPPPSHMYRYYGRGGLVSESREMGNRNP